MIPKPIIAVVEAARRFVAARLELREAIRSREINEAGLSRRRKAMREATKQLEAAVVALERQLEAAKRTRSTKPLPWGDIFKAAGEFAGLVRRVRAGDPTAVRDAASWAGRHGTPPLKNEDDIIDAEIVED